MINDSNCVLTKRQQDILKSIILEHIKTAETVGSSVLANDYDLNVSSATVRNEMSVLTEMGYIEQPYTSAGRIPTAMGYKFYINDIIDFDREIPDKKIKLMQTLLSQNYQSLENMLSSVLKFLANISGQMSIIAEPDFSFGILESFNIFLLTSDKLLIAISLRAGFEKTFIIPNKHKLSQHQIRAIERYLNDNFAQKSFNQIKHILKKELRNTTDSQKTIIQSINTEIQKALQKASNLNLRFEGDIGFMSQPEFNSQLKVLKLLKAINDHKKIENIFKNYRQNDYTILMGEETGIEGLEDAVLIFGKYEIMNLTGFIGILGTKRMNYTDNIPIICFAARMITELSEKGALIPYQIKNK
ncbi:MAG: heat-inducible transcriptional repressor HrcA [Candidatus Cloacimonadota bacterium]|nr:heat-inducible transcriptional repressor HrcA [Candidatus Cloacimonadota bacterium]